MKEKNAASCHKKTKLGGVHLADRARPKSSFSASSPISVENSRIEKIAFDVSKRKCLSCYKTLEETKYKIFDLRALCVCNFIDHQGKAIYNNYKPLV